MKTDIHPDYFSKANVKCACGATFVIGSTKESIDVEVCSTCHPFYVGDDSKKIVAGRLEKFKNRQATAANKREAAKATSTKRAAKKVTKTEEDKVTSVAPEVPSEN